MQGKAKEGTLTKCEPVFRVAKSCDAKGAIWHYKYSGQKGKKKAFKGKGKLMFSKHSSPPHGYDYGMKSGIWYEYFSSLFPDNISTFLLRLVCTCPPLKSPALRPPSRTSALGPGFRRRGRERCYTTTGKSPGEKYGGNKLRVESTPFHLNDC